jgi:signal transduction histidine kinase
VVPNVSEVRLGQVMEPALEAARKAAEHKGLHFTASYDADTVVRLDPLLTRSAVQNLADNATKYTDVGGVDISVRQGPDGLTVDVCDTCQGLSPAELRTIFEPFRRGRTAKAGTGLGLTIARRAVEAQGGTLDAESTGPVGCHFRIRLPAQRAVSDQLSAGSTHESAESRRLKG